MLKHGLELTKDICFDTPHNVGRLVRKIEQIGYLHANSLEVWEVTDTNFYGSGESFTFNAVLLDPEPSPYAPHPPKEWLERHGLTIH